MTTFRFLFCLLVLMSICSLTQADGDVEVQSLADAQLPLDQLADLPDQTYHMRMYMTQASGEGETRKVTIRPNDAGTLTLRTQVDGDVITLHDTLAMTVFGGMTINRTVDCLNNSILSPRNIEIEMTRGGKTRKASIQIKDNQAIATFDGQQQSHPFNGNLVSQSALFRLLPLLPREAGPAWTIEGIYELVEFMAREPAEGAAPFQIVSHGQEEITVGDTTFTCTRFVLDTGADHQSYMQAWVDAEGRVQQMLLGRSGDMRLTLHPMKPIDDSGGPFTDPFIEVLIKSAQ